MNELLRLVCVCKEFTGCKRKRTEVRGKGMRAECLL